jgi:hypothetical protein
VNNVSGPIFDAIFDDDLTETYEQNSENLSGLFDLPRDRGWPDLVAQTITRMKIKVSDHI